MSMRNNPHEGATRHEVERVSMLLLAMAALVVVTTPFDDAVRLHIPFLRNPSAVFGVALLCLYLFFSRGRIVLFSASHLWAITFLALSSVQEATRLLIADASGSTFTGTPSISVVFFLYMAWVQPIVLLLIVSMIAKGRKSAGVVLYGLPIVMGVLVIGGIPTAGFARWAPVGLNENFAGLSFGASIVIATHWLMNTPLRGKYTGHAIYAVSLLLSVFGLLMSASRGASAATLVAVCVLAVLTPVRSKNMLYVGVAMFAFVLGFGPYLSSASDVLVGRWSQTLEGQSFGSRDTLFVISSDVLAERPTWGHGVQANFAVGERWWGQPGRPFSPHSTILALLVTFGVVGSLPWFCMYASICFTAWRHRHRVGGVMLLSLLALFSVYMITGNISTNKLLYVTLGLAACLPTWARQSN